MLFQTSRTYFLLWNGKLDILKWRHIWPIFSQVVGTGDFQLENNIHKKCYIPNLWKSYNELFSQIHFKKYIIYICNALSLKQKIFKGNIKQFNAAAQSFSHAFYLHLFFFTLLFLYGPLEHVTHLFVSLHWLPVAARIKFNTLMLAYRTATGSAPSYLHSLMTIYIPSRSLRSTSERRLVVPSQRGSKSCSRTFSFTVPVW